MTNFLFSGRAASAAGTATALRTVTPSDSADLPDGPARGLYVAAAGTLRVADATGVVVDLVSLEAQYHPIQVSRVLESGTTAAGIVALY